jgi:type IV pilus assembly protein PilE
VLMMRHQRGFTLIELMIALVVLAILTAIAYPSYTNQVLKSRRADGIAALNRASMRMESCRSDNASYVGCEALVSATSEDGYYTIAAPASATATTYAFEATPQGAQLKDTKCTKLTLDSQGNRGFTGTAPNADTCWGQ